MGYAFQPNETILSMEECVPQQGENAIYHPNRRSIVSVTSSCVQEIDLTTGAIMGEIPFDLILTGNEKTRDIENVIPVGYHFVVAIYQQRFLIIWNLQEMALHSISELEKSQKNIVALAGSLCKENLIFYCTEGSSSIKVTVIDSKEIPKKIPRKSTNRSSQLTCLGYNTTKRLVCCGASDGNFQLWHYSEENTPQGKEENVVATMVFTAQFIVSPVICINFGTSWNTSYLALGYANKNMEIWDITSKQECFRVAISQVTQTSTVDFSKKNGQLNLCIHPEQKIVAAHWNAFGAAASSVVAWDFSSITSNTSSIGALASLGESFSFGNGGEGSSVCWYYHSLVCYNTQSNGNRSIVALKLVQGQSSSLQQQQQQVGGSDATCTTLIHQDACLSSCIQLSLEEYVKYEDVPSYLIQIAPNTEGEEFILQKFSLTTGEATKLMDFPVWKNYQGKKLIPNRLVMTKDQKYGCSFLTEAKVATRQRSYETEEESCSYAIVSINQSNQSAECGPLLEGRDVVLMDFRQSKKQQSFPFVAIVLASSGKSLCIQIKPTEVENTRIFLSESVQRMYLTPLPIVSEKQEEEEEEEEISAALRMGTQLLYQLFPNSCGTQELRLSSAHDFSLSSLGWSTHPHENIHNVIWSPIDSILSTFLAVNTNRRVVILNSSLQILQEYVHIERIHLQPQSFLWVAKALVFVTNVGQIRCFFPLNQVEKKEDSFSLLLGSLVATGSSSSSSSGAAAATTTKSNSHEEEEGKNMEHFFQTNLLSLFGDRICYMKIDRRTMKSNTFLRPFSPLEPIVYGLVDCACHPQIFPQLQAILQREALVHGEAKIPISQRFLSVLNTLGWYEIALVLVQTSSRNFHSHSTYQNNAHLSLEFVCTLFLANQQYRQALDYLLSNDPALQEYVMNHDLDGMMTTSSTAKLPSKVSKFAKKIFSLGKYMETIGQFEIALKCFDLAGNDLEMIDLCMKFGSFGQEKFFKTTFKDLEKVNPPFFHFLNASIKKKPRPSNTSLLRHQDLFSLLCCNQLWNQDRRTRLSSSHHATLSNLKVQSLTLSSSSSSSSIDVNAMDLCWKQIVPEDLKEWLGISMTPPHFSNEEPKNLSTAVFSFGKNLGTTSNNNTSGNSNSSSNSSNNNSSSNSSTLDLATSNSGGNLGSSKMTIGPFVEEEDAVVAYWRFEEGIHFQKDEGNGTKNSEEGICESMDTSKRENHLQLYGGEKAPRFFSSTAPVDTGEEGKLQEEFTLRFPSSKSLQLDHSFPTTTTTTTTKPWGVKCHVRVGSTLDIGMSFDEDPYRRKFTFEKWIRNYAVAATFAEAPTTTSTSTTTTTTTTTICHDDEDHTSAPIVPTSSILMDDSKIVLATRKNIELDFIFWELSVIQNHLVFEIAGQKLKSEEKLVNNGGSWQHVAFSIDVQTPKIAIVRLFLNGKITCTREIDLYGQIPIEVSSSASLLLLGPELKDFEITEIRLWAAARTAEQISDMKENYLGIAETKRRLKVAIHQRNCQCDKCIARKQKTPIAKISMTTPLPLSPAAGGTTRDRRRPLPAAK